MKNPWISGFLSILLPGLGQFYLGKTALGIIFLIGYIACLVMSGLPQIELTINGVFGIAAVIIWLISVMHAIIQARKGKSQFRF
ncbi:sugar ABC transporter permease [Pontibacillus salicampi]|uniref:Sugar ABC transporter permease n=1 Tax=Pontibacillus salicampi TaxID=1449801 RepID=A0ABV6LR61_9BACI